MTTTITFYYSIIRSLLSRLPTYLLGLLSVAVLLVAVAAS